MTSGHWFWWLLTMACLAWYSTITIYVAIKGVRDVRGMLRRLGQQDALEPDGWRQAYPDDQRPRS